MKINYIILENFANIKTAMNADKIYIDFKKAKNKVILLVGPNGSGKTSLLSLLTPFASIGNLDVRSTTGLIIEGKNGYKEIEIVDDSNIYLIKHFYTAKKDTHSVKSYIQKNGEELNPNGNVSSFKEWVKMELGIEMDYLKLIRIGSNVSSMINMTETERKTFLNKLLEEADIYLKYFKKVNDEVRQLKDMISHAVDKQNRLGIISIDDIDDKISELQAKLDKKKSIVEKIKENLSVSNHIINGIDDSYTLKTRLIELQKKVKRMEEIYERKEYESSDPSYYEKRIKELEIDIANRDTKISAHRIIIDNNLSMLDDIYTNLHNTEIQYNKELESDKEISRMESEINKLKREIHNMEKSLRDYIRPDITKDEIDKFIIFLKNMQQVLTKTYEFGLKPVKKVISLIRDNKNVIQYINNKLYTSQSSDTSELLISRLSRQFNFNENDIPKDCSALCEPKRLYIQLINLIRRQETKSKDDVSMLTSMEMVYQNIINVLSEFKSYGSIINRLPEDATTDFIIDTIYTKISNGEIIYNEKRMNELLSIITEFSTLDELKIKLSSMETTLNQLQKVSNLEYLKQQISSYSDSIDNINKKIVSYKKIISSDTEKNTEDKKTLEVCKELYETFTEYEVKKSELVELQNSYAIFKDNSDKVIAYQKEIMSLNMDIEYFTKEIEKLRLSIIQYNEIQKDLDLYNKVYDEMVLVKESLSSSKGIPLRYIKNYLGNTEEITNELLNIAYNGSIYIDRFKITQSEFTIPFYNRGYLLKDVKFASQGEVSFISIALAFALASQTMHKYNIMLLDEIDAALDISYKEKFLKILESQLDRVNGEQCFLITHGNMFSSYPVDIINFGNSNNDYEGTIDIVKD